LKQVYVFPADPVENAWNVTPPVRSWETKKRLKIQKKQFRLQVVLTDRVVRPAPSAASQGEGVTSTMANDTETGLCWS
jgi:hypothetical protein